MTEQQQTTIASQPKKFSVDDYAKGVDKSSVRTAALAAMAVKAEGEYRKYAATLINLISLRRETFNPGKLKIGDIIAPGAMGDQNSVYQLQNYVVGLSREGLAVDGNNDLDLNRSFSKVDYFDLLHGQKVRNNVQPEVSSRPVDFVAVLIPLASFSNNLPDGQQVTEDPIWLFGSRDKQALILSKKDANGIHYRYIPVAGLRQDADGAVSFQVRNWAEDFPLRYFEDADFAVPLSSRTAWLNDWHTESEWLNAIHKTRYSNAIIGVSEQIQRHPVFDEGDKGLSVDELLIRRFRQRQRHLAEPDLLILANDHWNFDVRGFNPGGNHGSFFRVSTNATFMLAGGDKTGIPRGLAVERPYDTMSFMPTILRLMGKIDDKNQPNNEMLEQGFRKFPGRVVSEILENKYVDPDISK